MKKGGKKTRGLTSKQKVFCDEYLIDMNATQAAIRAGYSKKTAEWIGPQLLGKSHVADCIAQKMMDRQKRTEITQDAVLKELAKIGFANMADYMGSTSDGDPYLDFSAITRDQAAALSEVTIEDFIDGRGEGARNVRKIKFKLVDKKGALVDIGKHLGMFRAPRSGEFVRLEGLKGDDPMKALLVGVADGEITDQQGATLARVVETTQLAEELKEIKQRLEALDL